MSSLDVTIDGYGLLLVETMQHNHDADSNKTNKQKQRHRLFLHGFRPTGKKSMVVQLFVLHCLRVMAGNVV